MTVTRNVVIELTGDDLKQIIADFLKKDGYYVPINKIEWDIGTKLEGEDPCDVVIPYVRGCTITIPVEV